MLNFVKSTAPNQAMFTSSKRKELPVGAKFDKNTDNYGAISTSGLQPASLANFSICHNAKLRQVVHAKSCHISEI